ncbi:MAG: DUF4837 family protein [Prevotellaceae bacterium]|jgi:hypothetical protein|nr:DUF4837 family protein [Prevotellaceae bacterium]
MKKFTFPLLGLLTAALLFTACGGKKKAFTSTSTGRAYEILVVIDPALLERPAGQALYDGVLATNVPGLPQPEPSFRRMYTSPKSFDSTLKLVRNIIIVDIQDIYSAPKMKYSKDVYSYPQMVMTIQAPDEDSFAQYVTENEQVIIDFFTHAEMNRQIAVLEEAHNDYVSLKVKSLFDCDVWVPAELSSNKVGENFFWAGSNTATADKNFVIYSFPYTDKNTFTKDYFVHKRDSVMKVNMPGRDEGMYMATNALLTTVTPITVQGEYTLEARGLWEMHNDMMGGPYVAHMRYDRANGRIVVAEVFVYSPDTSKRDLIRGLEAALYTLRMPNETGEVKIATPDVTNE